MEVRTRVLEVSGDRARLASEEIGHCDLCGGTRGCGLRLFGARRRAAMEVHDCAGAAPLSPGQLVLVSVAEGTIVRAAAASYLLPLAGLLGAAALARWFGAGETLGFIAALGGAAGAVWYARRRHAERLGLIATQRSGHPDG